MKRYLLLSLSCVTMLAMGCATAPKELVDARTEYAKAEQSSAPKFAPTELREARQALDHAEESFKKTGKDETTATLSYVAMRKARAASVVADTYAAQSDKETKESDLLTQNKQGRDFLAAKIDAQAEYAEMTARQLDAERAKLQEAEEALAESALTEEELAAERVRFAEISAKLDAERDARAKAEADLALTRAQLEKVASIKEEPTRMIITLNGSVLFETDQSSVRPAAQHRLDQVGQVLLAERGARITVRGYTDSQGSDAHNQTLSTNRAMSVRNYLIGKGVAADRIEAVGLGKANPIAPNNTETGRANNRRVEIEVNRQSDTSASL